MMQKLASDPTFWVAVTALLGLIGAWAKAKTADWEARSAKEGVQHVAAGQGVQQATLQQHTAQIAALEAVTPSAQGVPAAQAQAQASVPSAAPAPPPAPAATLAPPPPQA